MNGSGAAGICSLACGIRSNLGQSVRSLLSKRSTGLFRFALQTVCSPPGRGERYGQAVARGHSRAIRGPQLLSTPGQRHLSDVQANDACLIMHPVWSRSAQVALPVLPLELIARPPRGSPGASAVRSSFRAFSRIAGYEAVKVQKGNVLSRISLPSLHCRKTGAWIMLTQLKIMIPIEIIFGYNMLKVDFTDNPPLE